MRDGDNGRVSIVVVGEFGGAIPLVNGSSISGALVDNPSRRCGAGEDGFGSPDGAGRAEVTGSPSQFPSMSASLLDVTGMGSHSPSRTAEGRGGERGGLDAAGMLGMIDEVGVKGE